MLRQTWIRAASDSMTNKPPTDQRSDINLLTLKRQRGKQAMRKVIKAQMINLDQ